jgi:hypothetical protein
MKIAAAKKQPKKRNFAILQRKADYDLESGRFPLKATLLAPLFHDT